jgi:hypothetical protein
MPAYIALIYTPAEYEGTEVGELRESVMREYVAFEAEASAAGVVVGGKELQDTDTATTVQVVGGKGGTVITTDGPFAETKEVLGGFFLLECEDLDEAISWAAKIPASWRGKVELRPLVEYP